MHNTFARFLGRARGKDGTGIDNARAIKVVRKDIAERLNALMGRRCSRGPGTSFLRT